MAISDHTAFHRGSYISIIINTTGRNIASIRRLLHSIQDFRNHEVIIATESNGDKLLELCKELHMECVVIETGYWNRCRTANLAVIKSRGELVVLLEDDVELEASWLSKMVKCINAESRIGCTYSTVINPFGSESMAAKTSKKILRFITKAINALRAHYHFARKGLNVFSLTVLCRREALLRAGLFDMNVEEPIVAEDYDLALRIQKAGYRVTLCTEAKAAHYTLHTYKRAMLALKKGPKWWGKLIENDTYFFAKHYDLLGIAVLMHSLYNAFFSPFALLLKLREPNINVLLYFPYSVKGSFAGFLRGILTYRHFRGDN